MVLFGTREARPKQHPLQKWTPGNLEVAENDIRTILEALFCTNFEESLSRSIFTVFERARTANRRIQNEHFFVHWTPKLLLRLRLDFEPHSYLWHVPWIEMYIHNIPFFNTIDNFRSWLSSHFVIFKSFFHCHARLFHKYNKLGSHFVIYIKIKNYNKMGSHFVIYNKVGYFIKYEPILL